MPTVPGEYMAAMDAQENAKKPTPERLLMTAADMKARGQLSRLLHPLEVRGLI